MNPYRAAAEAARKKADALSRPTAYDEAMRNAFPLGAGYGRKGAGKRIEARVNRATKAVKAAHLASQLEAKADAYDRGDITEHGRPPARPKVKPAKEAIPDGERLLIGDLGGGTFYADRAIEKNGDYKRIAFLPKTPGGRGTYGELQWDAKRIPPFMRERIEQHAAQEKVRGQQKAEEHKQAQEQERRWRQENGWA